MTPSGFVCPLFPAAANFDLHTVPNTGHNLNLHDNVQETFGLITEQLRSMLA